MKLIIKDDDSVQIELDQSGGGNPNYVETIEGTLANPWGDLDYSSLVEELVNNNVNIEMDITTSGFPTIRVLLDFDMAGEEQYILVGSYIAYEPDNGISGVDLRYDSAGVISAIFIIVDDVVSDRTTQAEYFDTTLTVIHHPLPENSNN